MAELLPSLMANDLRDGLVDYLTTTFALADSDAAQALSEFLEEPDDGIFRGPYLRLRLPYRPAADDWRATLGWDPGLTPYGHQAEAYRRLTTIDLGPDKPRPLPTLVTTGTGSGKTEAFLHPILDHCVRANRAGVTGTKALILYPMNALATDQAGRLTSLLTTRPELSSVTAGIYIGQQEAPRTSVNAAGLINDRGVLRSSPPDILLTNYKMLDQLLLRQEDQPIWSKSATSLTYLVLDEFHTYDGAQGTDVALLLRRLGIALKSHWKQGDPLLTMEDRQRPLGLITPVATSATLGDKGDATTMRGFAETVFGETFGPDSVVTETRLPYEEWVGSAREFVVAHGLSPRSLSDLLASEVAELAAQVRRESSDIEALSGAILGALLVRHDDTGEALRRLEIPSEATEFLTLVQALPDVQSLVMECVEAKVLRDVRALLFPSPIVDPALLADQHAITDALIAVLSHVRALAGRAGPSVEVSMWVRELTRIDRDAAMATAFHWSDDGKLVGSNEGDPLPSTFPAIYCRQCGRSGWGVELATVGQDLHSDETNIRARHARHEGRFRPLLTAAAEADTSLGHGPRDEPVEIPGLVWLDTVGRALQPRLEDPDSDEVRRGELLPVLTHTGPDADELSNNDTCPSCLQRDSIRFLGSAIATLLSVTLSGLFGASDLDSREKKSLVFTDSVQDAAHRAGFVEARSHTLTFRAMLRDALGDEPCNLDELVDRVFQHAGDDPFLRYRMVPPDCIGRPEFDAWWSAGQPVGLRSKARARVKRRLLFDTTLELGLQSTLGRTLERTGSIGVEVDAGSPARIASIGRQAIDADQTPLLGTPLTAVSDEVVVAWVRGLLEHVRESGGIAHDWFTKYIVGDGRRWLIWGGRPRSQGMPAFPSGRSAPAFPKVGGVSPKDPLLDPVTSSQSWYAIWTARSLAVSAQHGAKLARALLERLAKADVLSATVTESGGTVYAIPPTAVAIVPLTDDDLAGRRTLLVCDVCQSQQNVTPMAATQLDDTHCPGVRCHGRVHATACDDNFYRRLYASADMRRIVSREHTSLLDDELRLKYEKEFKAGAANPNAPNVLVATPTLEMGIDIGDLSSVVLASLPRTVASYLQRVGRAGRLTGNSLNLAFVTGRGEYLPRLGDPLSVINGEVRPPATYLNAEEILKRQYLAFIIDGLARKPSERMPRLASGAMQATSSDSFLARVIADAEENAAERLESFLQPLALLSDAARAELRSWAIRRSAGDGPAEAGSSDLAAMIYAASQRWELLDEELAFRRKEIMATIPALTAAAEGPAATDDDRRDLRSAKASLMLVERHHREHRSKPWIASLEEYGLLPNYTLLDDSVSLDAAVTWRDPDTNEFISEPRNFDRAAALALHEFAPGATFYAQGLEMDIDGLDLGRHTSHVRPWAWCDRCGYGVDLGQNGPASAVAVCPRCGSGQIADAAQRFDVVELKRVMSEVRRDEDRIDESRDERKKMRFVIVAAPDFDPGRIRRQWSVVDGQFGAALYNALELRWINAGRFGAGTVSSRTVAGQAIPNVMFRVCASCGKADSDANVNRRSEHRPWCPQRTAVTEETRTVALSRTLTTQALSLTLPLSVTLGDSFAVPSLAAALLLGLRERMGGNPDHLAVVTVPAPVVGGSPGDTREALLLHDTVPGGTGYLTDLISEEEIWRVLATAYNIVATCPCQNENRLACHRCLLPFSRGLGIDRLSRVAAERHLRTILLGAHADPAEELDPGMPRWVTSDGPVGGGHSETPLELAFRKVFTERMEAINATVKEKPSASGNVLTINLPGERTAWTLTPQQLAHGAKPDFVLRSSDPTIPPLAIFVDGWKYHASPEINRIEDDATKRDTLRANGFAVIALTDADIRDGGVHRLDYDWVSADTINSLMTQPNGALGSGFNRDAVRTLTGGPMDFLVAWIQQPKSAPRQALANAMWLILGSQPDAIQLPWGVGDAALLALDLLTGTAPVSAGDGTAALWWRDGPMGVLTVFDAELGVPLESVIAIDDRQEAVEHPEHAHAWRRWLQIANAFIGADHVVSLASVEQERAERLVSAIPADARRQEMLRHASPEWEVLYTSLQDLPERQLVTQLSAAGVGVPLYGAEVADGIPVDFLWAGPRVVVLMEPDEETVSDLAKDGWVVVEPDVESIVAALRAGEGQR